MSAPAQPDWIDVRHGGAPLLLFAPHGGRRTRSRRPGLDKVNDLHTAELTRELGLACQAGWIINAVRDRNEVDLNRVRQVRERAPWLLELLATTLEDLVATHGHATLVAIHGWNVVQPVCDLGVGLVEERGTCRPAGEGTATVTPSFVRSRLRPLQVLARAHGVVVTIGARYPAAHPSNLMQLFTPARADDPDPLLRRLARLADQVDAVQLELGIPLRWAGPRRTAFMRALVEVLTPAAGTSPSPPRSAHAPTRGLACGGRPTTRVALQAASGPLAVLTSVDVAASGAVAGRPLITDAVDRLVLFTGELAKRGAGPLHVPALRFEARAPHAFDVRFAGPLLAFPMLTPFADLEHGLAAGELVEARLYLRFVPARPFAEVADGATRFGTVTGVVRLGRARYRVQAHGCANEGLGRSRPHPSVRLTLPATKALGDLELHSRAADAPPASSTTGVDTTRLRFSVTGTASRTPTTAVHGVLDVYGDPPATVRAHLETKDGDAHAIDVALERLVPVHRPGAPGTVVETIYALCLQREAPAGWLELTTEYPAADDGA